MENLKSIASEDKQPDPFLLPRLAENWENLTEASGSFQGVDSLPWWFITNTEEENSESSRKKKSNKYTWISRFLVTKYRVFSRISARSKMEFFVTLVNSCLMTKNKRTLFRMVREC